MILIVFIPHFIFLLWLYGDNDIPEMGGDYFLFFFYIIYLIYRNRYYRDNPSNGIVLVWKKYQLKIDYTNINIFKIYNVFTFFFKSTWRYKLSLSFFDLWINVKYNKSCYFRTSKYSMSYQIKHYMFISCYYLL